MTEFKLPKLPARPFITFDFVPQEDITAYELALLFRDAGMKATKAGLDKLPPEMRRHFTLSSLPIGQSSVGNE